MSGQIWSSLELKPQSCWIFVLKLVDNAAMTVNFVCLMCTYVSNTPNGATPTTLECTLFNMTILYLLASPLLYVFCRSRERPTPWDTPRKQTYILKTMRRMRCVAVWVWNSLKTQMLKACWSAYGVGRGSNGRKLCYWRCALEVCLGREHWEPPAPSVCVCLSLFQFLATMR